MYSIIITPNAQNYFFSPASEKEGISFEVEKIENALEIVKTFTELNFVVVVTKVDNFVFDKNLFE